MADNDPPDDPNADVFETIRKATLQGMKDYDRERDEWETAVAAQEKARRESEDDKPPGGKRDVAAFLLGGKSRSA